MRVRACLAAALLAPVVALAGCREGGVTPRPAVSGGDAERGRRMVAAYGCGGCHAVPDVPGAVGRVGPSLHALAARSYLAGTIRNDPETLVRWIQDPQALRPGTAMPDLNVGPRDARDIAAFLYTDHAGGLGPPHLLPKRWLGAH
ncbi:c-type cytochrome [Roseisolibacter agri]|nr:c-type cytochrome [Roseisolibacter agri]